MDGGRKRVLLGVATALTSAALAASVSLARADDPADDPAGRAAAATLTVLAVPPVLAAPEQLLDWAEAVLAGRCMVSHGFSFFVDWAPAAEHERSDPYAVLYGTTDVGWAAEHGYGINAAFHGQEPNKVDANEPYLRALTAAEHRRFTDAYVGDFRSTVDVHTDDGAVIHVGRTGCLAQARDALYGDVAAWAPLDVWATGLDARVFGVVRGEPTYGVALERWRSCMGLRGYPVLDPAASREGVAALIRTAPAEAMGRERAVAVADAGCNATSGLRDTAVQLHQAGFQALLAQSGKQADDYHQRRAKALALAADIASSCRVHRCGGR